MDDDLLALRHVPATATSPSSTDAGHGRRRGPGDGFVEVRLRRVEGPPAPPAAPAEGQAGGGPAQLPVGHLGPLRRHRAPGPGERHHVLFNLTGPGPVWAQGHAPRSRRFDQPAWKPSPTAFRQFVVALGRRYSGTWVDENQDRSVLPRVVIWSIYNEANQPASLSPQMEFNRKLRRQIPVAPILYRELYYAATDALRETGHGDDLIMMGETAPLGAVRNTPRVHLWPKQFIREMFCVQAQRAAVHAASRRGSAGAASCKRNGPFLVKAFAHHPYTQKNPPGRAATASRTRSTWRTSGICRRSSTGSPRRRGSSRRACPIALTEIGWETQPPDPTRGVSLKHQAEWINHRRPHGLRPAARVHQHAVRAARRQAARQVPGAAQAPQPVLGDLAVGPAVRQRPAQALLPGLPHALRRPPATGRRRRCGAS